jgi:hypothetical protein
MTTTISREMMKPEYRGMGAIDRRELNFLSSLYHLPMKDFTNTIDIMSITRMLMENIEFIYNNVQKWTVVRREQLMEAYVGIALRYNISAVYTEIYDNEFNMEGFGTKPFHINLKNLMIIRANVFSMHPDYIQYCV